MEYVWDKADSCQKVETKSRVFYKTKINYFVKIEIRQVVKNQQFACKSANGKTIEENIKLKYTRLKCYTSALRRI